MAAKWTSGPRRVRVFVAMCVAVLLAVALPAGATPTCPDEPREPCGGRYFPEAENSASFIQYDNGEWENTIEALERDFPRFFKARTFQEVLGTDKAVSFGGRPLWLIEITDFKAPESGKVAVAASIAVHGNERAGLEGAARYMEDLVTWAQNDPKHELLNGTEKDSVAMPVSEVLQKVHLYMSPINPDGWAMGDRENGGVFRRGNGNPEGGALGVDLNRQFPTKGWTNVSRLLPLSEPESFYWDKIVRRVDPIVSVDLHGELDSANQAFADIMYPAGQWNPKEQAQHETMARHMKSNIARWFEIQGVEASEASGVAGMEPAEYATGYDVVGYDDSGFMGDWFTEQIGTVDLDVEHFMSHYFPNSTWVPPLEDAHIASARGEIETIIVEALVTEKVKPTLSLGRVGYLYDAKVVTDKDANGYNGPTPPKGVTPQSYRATRMKYFEDLSAASTTPLAKVWSNEVRASVLKGFDTFVIADRPFPRDARGRKGSKKRIVPALKEFVRGGGNLVLTDRAMRLLPRLGIVPKEAVEMKLFNAGHVNIEDWGDPYVNRVHDTASQTYYEVPLGYNPNADASPHWTVGRAAWEKAGGKSIGYVGSNEDPADPNADPRTDFIGLGRVSFGKGTIGIFGAVLPPVNEDDNHLYGLADYALTVAGGQILNNMILFGR